jgi:hypothetical protein
VAYVGTPSNLGSNQATIASIIQGEAGGQGLTGMQAVGAVIANRANAGTFPGGSSILGVALAPNQFQGQNANYSTDAWNVAGAVLNGTNPDPTGGATYYANPGASSASWATNLNSSNALKIGDHYFTDNTNGTPFTGSGAAATTDGSGDSLTAHTVTPSELAAANGGDAAGSPTDTGGIVGFHYGGSATANADITAPPDPKNPPTVVGIDKSVTGTLGDIAKNLGNSIVGGISAPFTALGQAMANWFTRGALMLFAIVLIVVALILLAMKTKTGQTIVETTRTAAKAAA